MRVLSLLSAIVVALPVLAVAAEVPEENFYPTVKQEAGWMGYNSDNSIEYSKPSSLYAMEQISMGQMPKSMYVCNSLESTDCVRPEINGYAFNSIFTECASATDTDCIESFGIRNEDGSTKLATFQRNWGVSPVYTGSKSKLIPTGYGASSWLITDSNGVSETYALVVGVNGYLDLRSGATQAKYDGFFSAIQQLKKSLDLSTTVQLQM